MTAIAVMGAMPEVWAAGPPKPSSMNNPVVITFVGVMAILLLVIILLSNVILGTAGYIRQKEKEIDHAKKTSTGAAIATVLALIMFSVPVFAQEAAAGAAAVEEVVSTTIGGVDKTTFYLMLGVIGIEVVVILFMLFQLRSLIAKQKVEEVEPVVEGKVKVIKKQKAIVSLWSKLNSFKPIEQEADIELDHSYDGIRELDNRLPPWWLYGFYLTIIFAGVYLYRYHVSHTAPLQTEELQIAMKEAEAQKAEYLKKSANNIDENTVKYLSEATDLEAGKKVFEASCTPCHGKNAEGVVGPNLTDDHWIHGGSLSDVFKSIKYGWPEKGMKSWKDDFSPKQLAQLTSYIKSLEGSNPPNAKAPEGAIYKENGAAPATDSSKVVAVK